MRRAASTGTIFGPGALKFTRWSHSSAGWRALSWSTSRAMITRPGIRLTVSRRGVPLQPLPPRLWRPWLVAEGFQRPVSARAASLRVPLPRA